MKRKVRGILMIVLLLLAVVGSAVQEASADAVWDSEFGWINLDRKPDITPKDIYAYATGLLIKGHYAAAADRYHDVEERFPESPFAKRAIFARAQCAQRRNRLKRAIRITNDLLAKDTQPLTREEIIAFQLEAAKQLSGYSLKDASALTSKLGEHPVSTDLGYEIWMTQGDFRRRLKDNVGASEAYGKAMDLAADATRRGEALYQGALADLDSCREGGGPDCLGRALGRFSAFRKTLPEDARAVTADKYIDIIARALDQPDEKRRRVYYAITYMIEKRYKKAYRILKSAARRPSYRGTRLGETALFYCAECLYLRERTWSSFLTYERLFTEYPDTVFLHDIARRELAIGETLRKRGSLRKATIAFETAADTAANMAADTDSLDHVAAEAELSAGECYMARGKYDDAREVFRLTTEIYPHSVFADAAYFKWGVAALRSAETARNAASLLEEAQRIFEVYLNQHPNGVLAAEAASLLEECRSRQAETLFEVAKLYERIKKPKAAVWYYEKIVREYSGTASATAAEQRLEAYP